MSDNTENSAKILSEETVHQSKFFRIVKKQIERDGKTFTKEFYEGSSVAIIIPYTDTNEIYLISEYRDAFSKKMLEVVGGKIKEEGDILEAAKRELQEETGFTATSWKKLGSWELSLVMNVKIHAFAATGLTKGDAELDEDEKIDLIRMPLEEALKKIETGEIVGLRAISSLLLFDRLRKAGTL